MGNACGCTGNTGVLITSGLQVPVDHPNRPVRRHPPGYKNLEHTEGSSNGSLHATEVQFAQNEYNLNVAVAVPITMNEASRNGANKSDTVPHGNDSRLATLEFAPSDRHVSEIAVPYDRVSSSSIEGVRFTDDVRSQRQPQPVAQGAMGRSEEWVDLRSGPGTSGPEMSESSAAKKLGGTFGDVWVQKQDSLRDTGSGFGKEITLQELLAEAVALRMPDARREEVGEDEGDRFIQDMAERGKLFEEIQCRLTVMLLVRDKAIGLELSLLESALKELTILYAKLNGRDDNELGVEFSRKELLEGEVYETLKALIGRHNKELCDADTECSHRLLDQRASIDEGKVKSLVEDHLHLKDFIRTRQLNEQREEQKQIKIKQKRGITGILKPGFVPVKIDESRVSPFGGNAHSKRGSGDGVQDHPRLPVVGLPPLIGQQRSPADGQNKRGATESGLLPALSGPSGSTLEKLPPTGEQRVGTEAATFIYKGTGLSGGDGNKGGRDPNESDMSGNGMSQLPRGSEIAPSSPTGMADWDTHSFDGNNEDLIGQYRDMLSIDETLPGDLYAEREHGGMIKYRDQEEHLGGMYDGASDDDEEMVQIFNKSEKLDNELTKELMTMTHEEEELQAGDIMAFLTVRRKAQETLLDSKPGVTEEESSADSLWRKAAELIKEKRKSVGGVSTQANGPSGQNFSTQTDADPAHRANGVSVGTDSSPSHADADTQTLLDDEFFHEEEEQKRITKADKGLSKLLHDNPNMSEEELERLLKDHMEKVEKIKRKREAERLKMLDLLDKARKKKGSQAVSEEDARLEKKQEEVAHQYLEELKKRRESMSENEVKALLAKMRKEQEKIQETRNLEKLRNNHALAEKLAQRKKAGNHNSLMKSGSVDPEKPSEEDATANTSTDDNEMEDLDTQLCEEILKKQKNHELDGSMLRAMLEDHSSRVDKMVKVRGAERGGAHQLLRERLMEKKQRMRDRARESEEDKLRRKEAEKEQAAIAVTLVEKIPEVNKKIMDVRGMERDKARTKLEEKKKQLRQARQNSQPGMDTGSARQS